MTPTLEVQTATCTATSGSFKLSFNDGVKVHTTTAIEYDATVAIVASRLAALTNLGDVTVTFSTGVAACSGAGVGIVVTFVGDYGNQAMMTADVTALGGGTVTFVETTPGDLTQSFEVQTLTCTATSGTFTLTFRSQTTLAIAYDATAAVVETELEKLATIDDCTIAFSTGAAACSAAGVGIAVTFKSELGDLPAVTYDVSSLQGGAGTIVVAETTKGDKDNVECSEHGLCDVITGLCKCFPGWGSSDHNSNEGTRGDCGRQSALVKGEKWAPTTLVVLEEEEEEEEEAA
jgi:hypothetical protein